MGDPSQSILSSERSLKGTLALILLLSDDAPRFKTHLTPLKNEGF
jgi:hypothetical protein